MCSLCYAITAIVYCCVSSAEQLDEVISDTRISFEAVNDSADCITIMHQHLHMSCFLSMTDHMLNAVFHVVVMRFIYVHQLLMLN